MDIAQTSENVSFYPERTWTALCPVSQREGAPIPQKGDVKRKLPMHRFFGSQCPQCGADVIAPGSSEHISAHCVRNRWCCEICDHRFEEAVCLRAPDSARLIKSGPPRRNWPFSWQSPRRHQTSFR